MEIYRAASVEDPRKWVFGMQSIKQSIRVICFAKKYELCFNPDYGAGITDYLDRNIELIALDLTGAIYDALRTYETRITVKNVKATRVENGINILVRWIDNASGTLNETNIQ